MNLMMDREACIERGEEGASSVRKGGFAVEILVASLQKNSVGAQIQISVRLVKTSFPRTFPYGRAGLSFAVRSNSCE